MAFNITGLKVTFTGKGSHVSTPHLSRDPVFAAASFITQLQQIVSRNRNPASPAVCAITTIHGGVRNNIIPDEVVLEGSLRSPYAEEEDELYERVGQIVKGVSLSCGVEGKLEKTYFVPGTVIDGDLCREFRALASKVVGEDHNKPIVEWTPAGEDFAFFSRERPSLYFFHCSKFSGRENYPHHHPKFDIDESVFWEGSALFAAFAAEWTARHKRP
jgi:amidohydrolase